MRINSHLYGFTRDGPIAARAAGVALMIFGLSGAMAQVRPDAGRVQQELGRGRTPGPAPRPPGAPLVVEEEPPRPALTKPGGRFFLVKDFRITRNTAFADVQHRALLKDFMG